MFQLVTADGEPKPTPEGITLTTQRFYYLHLNSEDLTSETFPTRPMRRERRHLGYHYYATRISDGSVVLRYDKNESDISPLHDIETSKSICYDVNTSSCKLTLADVDMRKPEGVCESNDTFESKEPSAKKPKLLKSQFDKENDIEFDERDCDYIKLSWAEMKVLMSRYEDIVKCCYDLESCTPCITDHHNQMAYFECSECCPLGLQEY